MSVSWTSFIELLWQSVSRKRWQKQRGIFDQIQVANLGCLGSLLALVKPEIKNYSNGTLLRGIQIFSWRKWSIRYITGVWSKKQKHQGRSVIIWPKKANPSSVKSSHSPGTEKLALVSLLHKTCLSPTWRSFLSFIWQPLQLCQYFQQFRTYTSYRTVPQIPAGALDNCWRKCTRSHSLFHAAEMTVSGSAWPTQARSDEFRQDWRCRRRSAPVHLSTDETRRLFPLTILEETGNDQYFLIKKIVTQF